MRMWLRLGVALAFASPGGWAVDWETLRPEGYVSDFAHVIDAGSKARIESYAAEVERSTGAQMAIVTISSLEGEPVEDVSRTIFRAWGVGQKSADNGVLLLLAIQNRRSRLQVGRGLERVLPDDFDSGILKEMRPALRKQDYGDAVMAAAQTIGNAIAGAKHASIQTRLPRRSRPGLGDTIPWLMIAGGVAIASLLIFRGGVRGYSGGNTAGFLPGLVPGSDLSRGSWGSRGSGGFGGFDSGDGFGGFGGGDCGGGGASSDW